MTLAAGTRLGAYEILVPVKVLPASYSEDSR